MRIDDHTRRSCGDTNEEDQPRPGLFYGARHGAGHTATVDHPGGGEFANVASNWLRWQFKNDKAAAKMFVGKDCELCKNSTWDTRSKKMN